MINLLQKLLEKINGWRHREKVLLLMDHYRSHQKESIIRFCLDNNIEPIYLLAAATHFIQSLGNEPFAQFRQELISGVVDACRGPFLLQYWQIATSACLYPQEHFMMHWLHKQSGLDSGIMRCIPSIGTWSDSILPKAYGGMVQLKKSNMTKDIWNFSPIVRKIMDDRNRLVVKSWWGRFSLNTVVDGREGLQVIGILVLPLDRKWT